MDERVLKSVIWTLFAQNDYKEDIKLFKSQLTNYPKLTEKEIKDHLDEMRYILEEEESKYALYAKEYHQNELLLTLESELYL